MSSHTNYDEAYEAARVRADQSGRDVGIEKNPDWVTGGRDMRYRVFALPNEGNRYGYELRCEVVPPGSPRTMLTAAEREARS